MEVFTNRFAVGDKVTWRPGHWATVTRGRKRLGDVVTISRTRDVREYQHEVGHVQHVQIAEDDMPESWWSGAYFVHKLEVVK